MTRHKELLSINKNMEPERLTIQTFFSILTADDIAKVEAKIWEKKKDKMWIVVLPRAGMTFLINEKLVVFASTAEEAVLKVYRQDKPFLSLTSDEEILHYIKNSWWGKNLGRWIKPFSEIKIIE